MTLAYSRRANSGLMLAYTNHPVLDLRVVSCLLSIVLAAPGTRMLRTEPTQFRVFMVNLLTSSSAGALSARSNKKQEHTRQ